MRVEKIDSVNSYARRALNQNDCAPRRKMSVDYVSFTGKKEAESAKPSIMDRIKGVFKKEEIPEHKKSEQIKYYLGDVEGLIKEFKKQGKAFQHSLSNILYIGKANDFKGYIPLIGTDEKLVFGGVNPETEFPESATIMDVKKGFKPTKVYDIIDGTNLYRVHDCAVENTDITMDFLGGKLIHYVECDKKTGISKQLIPTSDGFSYFEGKLDSEGEPLETLIDIDFKHDADMGSTYKERNEQGTIDTYKYNKETDMWEKQPD